MLSGNKMKSKMIQIKVTNNPKSDELTNLGFINKFLA